MTDSETEALARAVLAHAAETGATLATAESCTGGMVAAAITAIAGSSTAFLAGFVTYSNAAKTAMIDVPEGLFPLHGAVSEPVAKAMAEGALTRSGATLAVSITGVAGPGASEAKPAGMVCFGLAKAEGATRVMTKRFDLEGAHDRAAVRRAATRFALRLLSGDA